MAAKSSENVNRPHMTYDLIERRIANHYPELVDARFLVVWKYKCKPDQDGNLFDGNVRKANPVERDMEDGHDLVIYLNYTLWYHPDFGSHRQEELIDRILSSIAVKSKDGEPVLDATGRETYRIRKPEFGGFFDVLARHSLVRPEYHRLAHIIKTMIDRGVEIQFQG